MSAKRDRIVKNVLKEKSRHFTLGRASVKEYVEAPRAPKRKSQRRRREP